MGAEAARAREAAAEGARAREAAAASESQLAAAMRQLSGLQSRLTVREWPAPTRLGTPGWKLRVCLGGVVPQLARPWFPPWDASSAARQRAPA